MTASKMATAQRRTTRKRRDESAEQQVPAAEVARPVTRRARRQPAEPAPGAPASAPRRTPTRGTSTKRTSAPVPAVAPCVDLELLQNLSAEAARNHVERYLHDVMSAGDADAFEASSYRWELHLVEIEQLRLVRGVDLDRKKVRRYGGVLKRGGAFPAVIGLGGDGREVTRDVLLCDGYHRAAAMRDAGIHFVWAWLATGLWPTSSTVINSRTVCAGSARN